MILKNFTTTPWGRFWSTVAAQTSRIRPDAETCDIVLCLEFFQLDRCDWSKTSGFKISRFLILYLKKNN
jgi:hypothetical protein